MALSLELTGTILVNRFLVCFKLFVLLFLVTPCLIVAVQLCME